MFAKLLKYEFKYVGKWYFALNSAILVIAPILGFFLKSLMERTDNLTSSIIPFSLFLILGALIASSWAATIFIIIKRFYNNIFGREGYLTLTLPASIHQIILSKLVASIIWSFFNALVIIIAILLVVIPSVGVKELLIVLPYIHEIFPESNTFFFSLYMLLSAIAGTLMIYLAIALGQLFTDRRVLMGFVFYVVLAILLSILSVMFVDNNLLINDQIYSTRFYYYYFVQFIVEIAIFYSGTYFIIKNKLNIQ
ncbi:MAG: ABC transporter permease [Streptococcus orisratti]|uniref:ABC transporter permease n=1 Tax=Streptococcus orisratti TaxID=114652 RepID=UPI002A91C5E6|nr:ABC transporter permease [Streptococcus orisratti]MDY5636134.1 ABC transporter permease [Streptococcus orisratti]